MIEFDSHSEEETRKLGRKFGEIITSGIPVLLHGDLGTGKTVFVRGVGDEFHVSGVRSPSFTLINEYESESGTRIIHADLYRLDDNSSRSLGLDEYIDDEDSIVFIEWPERMKSFAHENVIEIFFEALSESERRITFKSYGQKAQEVLTKL
jgi:tRNA threonylcarbamoyladenosine biosynthesis protein TsaE